MTQIQLFTTATNAILVAKTTACGYGSTGGNVTMGEGWAKMENDECI